MRIAHAPVLIIFALFASVNAYSRECHYRFLKSNKNSAQIFMAGQLEMSDPIASQMWNNATANNTFSSPANEWSNRDPILQAVSSLEVPDYCFLTCTNYAGETHVVTGCSLENCGDKTAVLINGAISAIALRRDASNRTARYYLFFKKSHKIDYSPLISWILLNEYFVKYDRGFPEFKDPSLQNFEKFRVRVMICSE